MIRATKFKVGDKVTAVGFLGVGFIKEVIEEQYPTYSVEFPDSASVAWIHEQGITLAEPDEQAIEGAGGSDPVNHPSHYTSDPSGVECIEITRHRDFLTGNAIKYLWRAGLKDSGNPAKEVEDLKKASWYISQRIELLTK